MLSQQLRMARASRRVMSAERDLSTFASVRLPFYLYNHSFDRTHTAHHGISKLSLPGAGQGLRHHIDPRGRNDNGQHISALHSLAFAAHYEQIADSNLRSSIALTFTHPVPPRLDTPHPQPQFQ